MKSAWGEAPQIKSPWTSVTVCIVYPCANLTVAGSRYWGIKSAIACAVAGDTWDNTYFLLSFIFVGHFELFGLIRSPKKKRREETSLGLIRTQFPAAMAGSTGASVSWEKNIYFPMIPKKTDDEKRGRDIWSLDKPTQGPTADRDHRPQEVTCENCWLWDEGKRVSCDNFDIFCILVLLSFILLPPMHWV